MKEQIHGIVIDCLKALNEVLKVANADLAWIEALEEGQEHPTNARLVDPTTLSHSRISGCFPAD